MLTASFLSSTQLLSSKCASLPASFAFYFCLFSHCLCPPRSPFLSIFITVLLTRSSSFLLQLQIFPVFSMLVLAVVTKHSSFLPVYVFFFHAFLIYPPHSCISVNLEVFIKAKRKWNLKVSKSQENITLKLASAETESPFLQNYMN